jgi:hypothetical protein
MQVLMTMNQTPTERSRWRSPAALIGTLVVILAVILVVYLMASSGGGGGGGGGY